MFVIEAQLCDSLLSLVYSPRMITAPERVLIIQLRRIGDTVLLTPVLDALREAWPDTRLHLLTEYPASDLFEGDDRLDAIWIRSPKTFLFKLLPDLRKEHYDIVLDFQSLPATSVLARATGATTFGFKDRFRTFHHAVDLRGHTGTHYTADHKLDLVRALGITPKSFIPRLAPPTQTHAVWANYVDSPKVFLSPVSPWAHKRWSSGAWSETVKRVHAATGAVFMIAGGPGEQDVLNDVASRLPSVPHETLCLNRLRDLSSLLAGADLFLGNDNGPRHMALALGLPTVGYFSQVNPIFWTPPDPRHPVLWDLAHARGRSLPSGRTILPPTPESAALAAIDLLKTTRVPVQGKA